MTAPARAAANQKFDPEERARRADAARRTFMLQLALRSSQVRARRRGGEA
jgi:hypothetical protein